jgi:FkbM family methyltransferase
MRRGPQMLKWVCMIVVPIVGLVASATTSYSQDSLEALKSSKICNEKVLYSQLKEEVLIRHFFNDAQGKFFLDVGCSDYKKLSTTYYLEKHLHWKGIGVDALKQYEADYLKYRPGTRFRNFAASNHSGGTIDLYTNKGSEVFSTTVQGAVSRVRNPQVVKVPVITLNDLLRREKVSRIDFLSMDIEGAELKALEGFDIKKYRPFLVCIEVQAGLGSYFTNEITDYFQRNGYERIEAYVQFEGGQNWYFKPKGYYPESSDP